jgi:hypothetical protein
MSMRDLAEEMAEFFSTDAAQWPVNINSGRIVAPVRVAFRWFGPFTPPIGHLLLDQLATVLAESYQSDRGSSSVSLQQVPYGASCDAEILLAEVPQNDRAGVAYEIRFTESDDEYPGWFSLPSGMASA